MPASNYLENKIIDHAFTGKTAFTMPAVYVGLSSTTPTATGTNVTEPSTGSYARVATSGATWNASATGSTTNSTAITFPTATADWLAGANLTYAVGYDAATAGNVLWFAVLSTAKNILSGDTASLASGQVSITIT